MAAGGAPQPGRFHLKCSSQIILSTYRQTAWTKDSFHSGVVFSKYPIPKGQKFSVAILQPGVVPRSRYDPDPFLAIGVTTTGPDSEEVLRESFRKSDHHWFVTIDPYRSTWEDKGHLGPVPWELASSEGRTAGCWVSENGDFRFCCGEADIGDVMGKGLPTDKPLWGFVALQGEWKVQANYKVVMAKGHPKPKTPAGQPQDSSPTGQPAHKAPAGHQQDYDGETFHFVEGPPERLECVICQALAHDPVQAKCCGKIYCTQCIEKWKTESNSCPYCRSTEQSDPPFSVFEDKSAHQHITSLVVYCPCQKEGCDKTMELSEVKKHLTSDNCFLSQEVECEYKQFGCTVVLPRRDITKHLKTSVETHLQLTKRRVKEQEVHLQEEKAERQIMEMELKNVEKRAQIERQKLMDTISHKVGQMEDRAKKQETRLKAVEERAEKERQIMKEVIAHREEQAKNRAVDHEARLQERTERKLMEEKMHKTNTLMVWLLVYVPVLLVVVILVGYHQGLLPPILAVMLSYVLCLFSAIHYRVL